MTAMLMTTTAPSSFAASSVSPPTMAPSLDTGAISTSSRPIYEHALPPLPPDAEQPALGLSVAEDGCRFYGIALYDYEPAAPDQLRLTAGDLVAVVDDSEDDTTGWLGALNLDSTDGAAGWVSSSYLHQLQDATEADEYVQGRAAPATEVMDQPVQTLEGLILRFVIATGSHGGGGPNGPTSNLDQDGQIDHSSGVFASNKDLDADVAAVVVNSPDADELEDSFDPQSLNGYPHYAGSLSAYDTSSIATDRRSTGALSLASMATAGSFNSFRQSQQSESTLGFAGLDIFLRSKFSRNANSLDSGSNSGSGSSNSTIKSGYPNSLSLRSASATQTSFYAGDGTNNSLLFNQGGLSSGISGYYDDSSSNTQSGSSASFSVASSDSFASSPPESSVTSTSSSHANPYQAQSGPPSTSKTPFHAPQPHPSHSANIDITATAPADSSSRRPTSGPRQPSTLHHAQSFSFSPSAAEPSLASPNAYSRQSGPQRPGLIIPQTNRVNALREVPTSTPHYGLYAPTPAVPAVSPTRSIVSTNSEYSSSGRSSSKGSASTYATTATSYSDHKMAHMPSMASLSLSQYSAGSGASSGSYSASAHAAAALPPFLQQQPSSQSLSKGARNKAAWTTDDASVYENSPREEVAGGPIPWYLEPSYHPDELRFTPEGVVEAGTLNALVEWLTMPRSRVVPVEREFRDAFLATYRSFTDATTLMNLLAGRYEMSEPENMNKEQFEHWKLVKLRPVQLQVLVVLRIWIQDHHLLDSEPEEVPRIREFLTYIKTPEKHEELAQKMLKLIDGVDGDKLPSPLSPSSAGGISASSTFIGSTSSLATSITPTPSIAGSVISPSISGHSTTGNSPIARRQNSKSSTKSPTVPAGGRGHGKDSKKKHAKPIDALQFSSNDLAAQMTLMEYDLYRRISANELIALAKDGNASGGNASNASDNHTVRNLQNYSSFNRKLAKAAKYMVLMADAIPKRKDLVLHLIKVIERCREFHNFAALHFLMVGVTAPCLEKLSFTWQAIERDKPRLDALRTLTRSYDNYAAYRAEYSNAHTSGATCIPVIGIYLPQLRSIVTSQNDFITISSPHTSATSLINFAKCRAMAEICRTALQFQARPPKREEVSQNLEIQAWILEQLEVGNSKPDAWYNEYSKDVQKQELEHGDIRRGLEAAGF